MRVTVQLAKQGQYQMAIEEDVLLLELANQYPARKGRFGRLVAIAARIVQHILELKMAIRTVQRTIAVVTRSSLSRDNVLPVDGTVNQMEADEAAKLLELPRFAIADKSDHQMALDVPIAQYTPEPKTVTPAAQQTIAAQARFSMLTEAAPLAHLAPRQLQVEEVAPPFESRTSVTIDRSEALMATAAPLAQTTQGPRTSTLPVLQMLVIAIRSPPVLVHVLPVLKITAFLLTEDCASTTHQLLNAVLENKFPLMADTAWHVQTTLGHKTETGCALLTTVAPTKS